MANVHARPSTSSSTTSKSGDAESTSSRQRDRYPSSESLLRRPSAFDLYTSSAATASTSSAALKAQGDERQQAAANAAAEEANSEHSRYLKRKEQNRLAQRRHREKQRHDLEAKRQRRSDSGESSGQDLEDEPSSIHSVAPETTAERVRAPAGRKRMPKRRIVEGAASSPAVFAFDAASANAMDGSTLMYGSNAPPSQAQLPQRSSLPQAVYPDLSASSVPGEARLSLSTTTSGGASTPSYDTHHAFYDESSRQIATSPFAIDTNAPWPQIAPWGWPNAGLASKSQPISGSISRPPEQAQLPIAHHPPQHSSALQSWQFYGNTAASQNDHHRIQRNQEQAMRHFVSLVSQSIPWMDHLLAPRWDMIKVLKQAAEQLGLMQDYLEEDESVSFLHGDYRVASRNTISAIEDQQDIPSANVQARPDGLVYPSAEKTDWQIAEPIDAAGGSSGVTVSVLRWNGWPSNMNPSRLSGVVPHHPFLDLAFPWPNLRDKVFAAIACDFLIEKRFCDDVWPGQPVEDGAYPEPPYTVHGDDAFDPAGYEISNRFALRYGPLIDASIFRRTNWWRRQQGKEELPRSILDLANYFEGFFAAQIRHLLQPAHHPAPMRPPVSLPWPLQLLGSGTSMLNGQTQTMPIQELS